MLMPFTKILDKYRRESFSEANKGTRFEELIREYLWADPKYGVYLRYLALARFSFFDKGNEDYRRHSGISDFILQRAREEYGPKVTHEDVFFYVYGLLHSPDYPPSYSSRFDALSALSLTLTSITTLCYNFFRFDGEGANNQ